MSQIVIDVLIVAGSVLLAASVIIALYRIVRGPSILDRMIGTDVVLASIMCGLGGYMAHVPTAPICCPCSSCSPCSASSDRSACPGTCRSPIR
jgi:hypothetical protein